MLSKIKRLHRDLDEFQMPRSAKELLHVSVGKAEPQIPPDGQGEDFRREPVPGERRTRIGPGCEVEGEISCRESARWGLRRPNATVPCDAVATVMLGHVPCATW